jgi:hypothetical protein
MTLVSQGVMATMNTQQAGDYTHTVHAPHQGNRLVIIDTATAKAPCRQALALCARAPWYLDTQHQSTRSRASLSTVGSWWPAEHRVQQTGSSRAGFRRSQHGARIPTLDTEHNDRGSPDLGSSAVSSTPVRSRGARTAPPSPLHYYATEGSHLCDGSRFALAHATHRRQRAGPISYHHETETTLDLA